MSSLVNNQSSSSASSSSCLRFSLGEIERAAHSFHFYFYVCHDNDGEFYHGDISENGYSGKVSIKRFHYELIDYQPLMFRIETKLLAACQHVNVNSPVGFCDENDEKILVYEFMPKFSLHKYLHKEHYPPPRLTVEQRLEICLGVAKGLCYLHSGTDFAVIHGNLNSENVLLDASLVPKISGFGHARTYDADPSFSERNISNRIKDANGDYTPPEGHEPYYKPSQKGDVYAFGVLFLEALCERQPSKKLLFFAIPSIMKGELSKSTPNHVKESITPTCAWRCEKIIMNCLEFQEDKRPCMNQVVQDLELALKLQKYQNINFEEQSSAVNDRCQIFSLVEIERARSELSNRLGEGGFGEVYRGKISINGNNVDVAMKFLSTDPERGIHSFEIEKKLLSACNHVNIISLIGYCDEKDAKILVYEFMSNGSLYDYLYKPKDGSPRLTVEQRLEICLGVAKGLGYLHSRDDYNIIHSDLKTDNILLDANLVPKISDFGLSRTRVVGPSTSSQVTKNIQGTEGYLAPECYEPNYKLSRKADVYAFGVVLLEVLCEKPAWERLVIWALPFVSKGELPKFAPAQVLHSISPECSQACANIIRDCLDIDPNNRPSMSHVIANLDLSLTLQKMNNNNGNSQKSMPRARNLKTFSVSDIVKATNAFSQKNLLGESGVWDGKVYHGSISLDVAVKRLFPCGEQCYVVILAGEEKPRYICAKGIYPFQNEIDSLSTCHHANIISLLGYCVESHERILIYEFMPNGSLYDHLHSKQDSAIHLTVEQRLEICLGVAKGLSYLHSSNIIHAYLNSKNILLDRNFVAKITSFELSTKVVMCADSSRPSETILTRMHGYLAPEFNEHGNWRSQELDVYAFGVLFLEVLCERLFHDNLITFALPLITKGELVICMPKHVGRYVSRKCAQACENVLEDCLDDDPNKRTSMYKVVEKLELALKLQKEEPNY